MIKLILFGILKGIGILLLVLLLLLLLMVLVVQGQRSYPP